MPGNPKLHAFERHIEEMGGDDVVFAMLAEGDKMGKVAETFRGFLDSDPDFPSRTWMYTWLRADPDRHARFKSMRKAQADEAYDTIEELLFPENERDAPATRVEMGLLKERVSHLRKKAAVFDPEGYGEKKEAGVQILSVGELHLDALRKAGSRDLATSETKVLEAEVEDVE